MGAEDNLTSRAREYASVQIAFGVVGGFGDADGLPSHYDKGDPNGKSGERHTLVYVTLGGGNAAQLRGPERGRLILCSMSSLVGSRIPKKGTRVLVATPPGMEESPGAPVIIATIQDDPERLEDDRRVLDFTGEHVIIRGKSVTLESDEGEFVAVGEPRSGGTSGITIQAKDGSGAIWQVGVASMFVAKDGDAKSMLQMTPTKVELLHKVSEAASCVMRFEGPDFLLSGPGTGFVMPATLMLGAPDPTGIPPYVPVGTPAPKIAGSVFFANKSPV